MPVVNQIPEKMTNYNVYNDGDKLVGVSAEVTLPTLEAMTETISGAGIAGEVDSPTLGHFGSTTMDIVFRTILDQTFSLFEPRAQLVTLRGSQQNFDTAGGQYVNTPVKVTTRVQPKTMDLGVMGVGMPTNSTITLEVLYIKVEVDGVIVLEYDKYNFIFIVNGTDYLADIKNQIG